MKQNNLKRAQKIRYFVDKALADYEQSKRVLIDKNQLICNELNLILLVCEYLTNEDTPKDIKKQLGEHITNCTKQIYELIH